MDKLAFDFDRKVDRQNTYSFKWDQSLRLFGTEDILPLWVADMDFECPPAVKEAIINRASHGVYGYTIRPESYTKAIVDWFSRRHDWEIDPAWLSDTPGVVPAISLAIELFSEVGDQVILQSPVYYPFYDVIRGNGRVVAKNPLVIRNGRYEMNYEHLEQLMKEGARLMLLCSPHNPVGRVWEREELERLAALCLKYNVTVVSDEIHCDTVFSGKKHIPFASLSTEIANQTLTCLAPTKTFNFPGLQVSFTAIANSEMRRKFERRIKTLSLHMANYFHIDAVIAAYNESEDWLDQLLDYLQGNADYAINYFREHLPEVTPYKPEGTMLLWVDCRRLGLTVAQLKQLMYEQAKVAFSEGSTFGEEGEGYLRINLACPRHRLHEALARFCQAARAAK